MNIPHPYNLILNSNLNILEEKKYKLFVNSCFDSLIDNFPNMGFQSRAKKSGALFEYIFYFMFQKLFDIRFVSSYSIPEACMKGGGELDFAIVRNGQLKCGIETKGSAEKIGGQTLTRPALKRTDTVKKAIAQAYQFKRIYPNIPFYLVTNVKPTSGNAKCMLDLAEGDIVEKIIDITNSNDIDQFLNDIQLITNS